MRNRDMLQTNLFSTKMAGGTSMLAAITAWLPHVEAALRIGASLVAIIAGIYAILGYIADRKQKRKNYEQNPKNTRTGSTGGKSDRLHGG